MSALTQQGLSAERHDGSGDVLSRGFVIQPVDRDVGASFGKRDRHRPANALLCPGNQNYPTVARHDSSARRCERRTVWKRERRGNRGSNALAVARARLAQIAVEHRRHRADERPPGLGDDQRQAIADQQFVIDERL